MLAHHPSSADVPPDHPSSDSCDRPQLFHWIRVLIGWSFAIALLARSPANAVEFSVKTAVYVGENTTAVEERMTIFSEGRVVDLPLRGQSSIYVLDTLLDELTVVNETKQVTSTVAANELARFVADQQLRIAKMRLDLRNRLLPLLKPNWDPEKKMLELSGEGLRYRALLATPNSVVGNGSIDGTAVVLAYRKFTDRMARYNAMQPQGMPPQSRLKLNDEIFKLGRVPIEITKTTNLGAEIRTVRSTHQFSSLRKEDHQRSKQAVRTAARFPSLQLHEFFTR